MLRLYRMLTLASVALLWDGAGSPAVWGQASADPQPPLTQSEKDAGWRLLFDGRNPDQWRGFGQSSFPTNRWNVEDGCLHLMPHVRGGGDLVSVEKFTDSELTWEWRISFGGNSGLKYLINEEHGSIGPKADNVCPRMASSFHAGMMNDIIFTALSGSFLGFIAHRTLATGFSSRGWRHCLQTGSGTRSWRLLRAIAYEW